MIRDVVIAPTFLEWEIGTYVVKTIWNRMGVGFAVHICYEDELVCRKYTPICGEWITVRPLDCMTLVPVMQCSICGNLESGYLTDEDCNCCGVITN